MPFNQDLTEWLPL